MGRKTFKVNEFRDWVNERNRTSTCAPEIRQGWNTALENVLHDTGNYRGYGYLTEDEVPAGQRPGIRQTLPYDQRKPGYKPSFPDESRRYYYGG